MDGYDFSRCPQCRMYHGDHPNATGFSLQLHHPSTTGIPPHLEYPCNPCRIFFTTPPDAKDSQFKAFVAQSKRFESKPLPGPSSPADPALPTANTCTQPPQRLGNDEARERAIKRSPTHFWEQHTYPPCHFCWSPRPDFWESDIQNICSECEEKYVEMLKVHWFNKDWLRRVETRPIPVAAEIANSPGYVDPSQRPLLPPILPEFSSAKKRMPPRGYLPPLMTNHEPCAECRYYNIECWTRDIQEHCHTCVIYAMDCSRIRPGKGARLDSLGALTSKTNGKTRLRETAEDWVVVEKEAESSTTATKEEEEAKAAVAARKAKADEAEKKRLDDEDFKRIVAEMDEGGDAHGKVRNRFDDWLNGHPTSNMKAVEERMAHGVKRSGLKNPRKLWQGD